MCNCISVKHRCIQIELDIDKWSLIAFKPLTTKSYLFQIIWRLWARGAAFGLNHKLQRTAAKLTGQKQRIVQKIWHIYTETWAAFALVHIIISTQTDAKVSKWVQIRVALSFTILGWRYRCLNLIHNDARWVSDSSTWVNIVWIKTDALLKLIHVVKKLIN